MRLSFASMVLFMRLTAVPLLCVFTAAVPPAHAQQINPDGFSICTFSNPGGNILQLNIGPCQPLSDRAMQGFGLSAKQTEVVAMLKALAAKPVVDLPPPFAHASLGEPKQFSSVGAFTDYWSADVTNAKNANLGVHLRYVLEDEKPHLFQMTYAVDSSEGHFTVLWNRAVVKPRQ